MSELGKIILFAGLGIAVIGLIIWLAGDKLSWFGNLPGDINIKKDNVRIFFPVTTMILLSILLSVVFWLIRKFF